MQTSELCVWLRQSSYINHHWRRHCFGSGCQERPSYHFEARDGPRVGRKRRGRSLFEAADGASSGAAERGCAGDFAVRARKCARPHCAHRYCAAHRRFLSDGPRLGDFRLGPAFGGFTWTTDRSRHERPRETGGSFAGGAVFRCKERSRGRGQASAEDRRFRAEEWGRWPFSVYADAFLAAEGWWDEATSEIKGATRHHLEMVNFVARQALDTVAPSNSLPTNPSR